LLFSSPNFPFSVSFCRSVLPSSPSNSEDCSSHILPTHFSPPPFCRHFLRGGRVLAGECFCSSERFDLVPFFSPPAFFFLPILCRILARNHDPRGIFYFFPLHEESYFLFAPFLLRVAPSLTLFFFFRADELCEFLCPSPSSVFFDKSPSPGLCSNPFSSLPSYFLLRCGRTCFSSVLNLSPIQPPL